MSSSPFQAVVRRAARASHAAIISDTGLRVSLTVEDAGVIVRNALAMHPQLAEKIPARATTALTSLDDLPASDVLTDLFRIARRMRLRAVLLIVRGI